MKPFDLAVFREAIAAGRIEWRKHVLQKLAERGIAQQAVRDVLLNGERIRDYTDDKPFPSARFSWVILPADLFTRRRRVTKQARRHSSLQLMSRQWKFLNRTIGPNENHELEK